MAILNAHTKSLETYRMHLVIPQGFLGFLVMFYQTS